MMTTSPCFQCPEKEPPYCHTYCKKYIEFCEIHNQERETIRRNKEKDSARQAYMTNKQFQNALRSHKNRVFKQTKR